MDAFGDTGERELRPHRQSTGVDCLLWRVSSSRQVPRRQLTPRAHKAVKRQPDEEEWMSRGDRSEPIDLAEPVTTKSTATVIFGDPEADTAETLLRAMARLDAKCPYTK